MSRTTILEGFVGALLVVLVANWSTPSGAANSPVAFVDVNVVPMDREIVLPHQTVIVENGKIVTLGPTLSVKIPHGARRIDGKGRYLMPGGQQLGGHDGQERGFSSAFYINPQTYIGAVAFANGNYADLSMNYSLVDLDSHLMAWFGDLSDH